VEADPNGWGTISAEARALKHGARRGDVGGLPMWGRRLRRKEGPFSANINRPKKRENKGHAFWKEGELLIGTRWLGPGAESVSFGR